MPCLRMVTGERQFSIKRQTQAAVLVNLVQLKNLCGSSRSSVVNERNVSSPDRSFVWPNFRSSTSVSLLCSILVGGNSEESCLRNDGPFHHLSCSLRVETLRPLVSKSAGFCFVEARISPTRSARNGLNFLLCPRIQCITSILSDQKAHSSFLMPGAWLTA